MQSLSANIPAEKLGPAGVKGEFHILAIMENETRRDEDRLHDQSERQFKVAAQLSKSPPTIETIKGDFGVEDGSSYFLLPKGADLIKVGCPEGMFEIRKNQFSEQSLVHFECSATGTTEARKKFQSAVLPFLDYISYLVNCPLFVATLRIEDPKNDRIALEYISPYRKTTINPHIGAFPFELAPIFAIYREAKNSHSDFYKFLCYHKILEGLLGTLRAKVFARARKQGVTLQRPKDTVPASPEIAKDFQVHVGKSVKAFFDTVMTPQFRNAVAHFITTDGALLNMSSPTHIDNYAKICFISELCVRTVIQSHDKLLKELHSKGVA
jgi:hypothetical protein